MREFVSRPRKKGKSLHTHNSKQAQCGVSACRKRFFQRFKIMLAFAIHFGTFHIFSAVRELSASTSAPRLLANRNVWATSEFKTAGKK